MPEPHLRRLRQRGPMNPAAPTRSPRWPGDFGLPAIAAIFALAFMVWLGSSDDSLFGYSLNAPPTDYYNELADGFLSGHLYMKAEPHPDLLSPNPEIRRSAPTLLDAGFYRGHFYLYYGVTPVVLTFLPYAWLTGRHLSPNLVTLLFVATGFLYALALLRAFAARHSARLSPGIGIGLVLFLAFASGTPPLLVRSMFYEVPVAAGYACVMGGCFHLYRALFGRARPQRHLMLASLWLGLAVGCRPNYVLVIPVLLVAAYFVWRHRAASDPGSPNWLRVVAASVLPAALIGAGLAVYNYVRFGSIFEFGFKYGQNEFFSTSDRLVSPAFIWTNLKWYYLTPASVSPYFPFIFPLNGSFLPKGYHGSEAMHGQLMVTLLSVFVGLSVVAVWWRAGRPSLKAHGPLLGILAWVFLSSLGFTMLLGIRANRYAVDFHATLVLGVALTAAMLAVRVGRWWRRVVLVLAVAAAGFNVLVALQQFDEFRNRRPQTFRALAGVANVPSAWAARLGLLHYGPLRLRVSFNAEKESTIQPLVALGTPGYSDSLCVIQHPGRLVEFMVDHSGYGGPKSGLLPIEMGRIYEITFDTGALYPPLQHSFFDDYDPYFARQQKISTLVTLDGTTIIRSQMQPYDAPPWTLRTGQDHITYHGFITEFTGSILSAERLPIKSLKRDWGNRNGLWRLRCALPLQLPGSSHPLLASGVTGAGNLLFLKILPGGQVQFALDQWSYGASSSDAILPAAGTDHTIECFIGPQAARYAWTGDSPPDPKILDQSAHTLRVWLDGKPVWSTSVKFHLDSYGRVEIASNTQGFSSAPELFSGELSNLPFTEREAQTFLRRNLELAP